MEDITRLTISEARELLSSKKISATELVQAFLGAIKKHSHLNAFITLDEDGAINQAKQSDLNIQSGKKRPLEGIPLAMKDLFCSKGVRTTAGSKILENFIPPYESGISERLINDGAIVLGKTNMDEFAMGSANITSYFGNVINPWVEVGNEEKPLVPGGSSGGSATAVAGHLCLGATGSDTGGSIRQPASFCGIVGLKPTYGRCSRWGMIAFASSLDQAGPLTKSVNDCAIMLNSMSGYDMRDATSANINVPDFELAVGKTVRGLRVGILKDAWIDNCSADIKHVCQNSINCLKDAGAEIVDISLPYAQYSLAAYYVIAPAEASSNLSRFDGVRFGMRADVENMADVYKQTRREGFGDEVRRRIMIGTYALSAGHMDAYYQRAKKVQALIKQSFDNIFESVDIILTPTTPTSAFGIGEKQDDPITMYLNDMFTVPVNMAGLPAISVPAGLDAKGLPLGIQLISAQFREETLLSAGYVIEKSSNFKPWGC